MRISTSVWRTAVLALASLALSVTAPAAEPTSGDKIVVRPITAVRAPASTRIDDGTRAVTLMDADTGLEVIAVGSLPPDQQAAATELMFGLETFNEEMAAGKTGPPDLSSIGIAMQLSPAAGSAVAMLTTAMNDPRCSAQVLSSAVNTARAELQKSGLSLSATILPRHGDVPARANLTVDLIREPAPAPGLIPE